MPYNIRKTKGGYVIYHRGGGRAVKKTYRSKKEAKRVARLRMYYAGEK